jgi:hypothetical protein
LQQTTWDLRYLSQQLGLHAHIRLDGTELDRSIAEWDELRRLTDVVLAASVVADKHRWEPFNVLRFRVPEVIVEKVAALVSARSLTHTMMYVFGCSETVWTHRMALFMARQHELRTAEKRMALRQRYYIPAYTI